MPPAAKRLSRPLGVKAQFKDGVIMASSVAFAVKGESVFSRPPRADCEIETFEGFRPDALCDASAAGGAISGRGAPDTPAAQEEHRAGKHKCLVEECSAGKSQASPHAMAKFLNCRGSHMTQSDLYPKKKEARQAAKGWGLPPSAPRRTEGTTAPSPSANPPPEAVTAGEEMEVEGPAQHWVGEMQE